MPNLKVLGKIFSKLLHAETNLCGGDNGMIGLYESHVSIIIILKDKSSQEIDTTCNQGVHTLVWL